MITGSIQPGVMTLQSEPAVVPPTVEPMSGTVEWVLLSALLSIAGTSALISWVARGMLSGIQLALEINTKDIRHLKNNFEQHKIAAADDHDLLIRTAHDVAMLAKMIGDERRRSR